MAPVSAWLGGIVVACLGFIHLGWRRRTWPAAWPFLGVAAAMLVWTAAYIWEIEASSVAAMVLAAKMQYLAIPLLPVGTLAVTLTYIGRWGWRRPLVVGLALVIPLTTTILAWTNELHGLVWREITPVQMDGWSVLSVRYGAFFWVFVPYSYLCLFSAFGLVLDAALRTQGLWRRQATFIAVGIAAPLVGNVLHVTKLAPFHPLDLTVFLFAVSSLALALPALNPGFLTLAPIARDMVLDFLDEGVVVLDERERIIDMNRAAASILEVDAPSCQGRGADEVLGPFRAVKESEPSVTARVPVPASGGATRTYQCSRVPLSQQLGAHMGSALVISDVTELDRAHQALAAERQALAERVRERTQELEQANRDLQDEIQVRESAQRKEREMEARLRHAQKLETVGTLAGGIAHDFNNLLAVILGYTELAEADLGDDASVRESLQRVMEAANRAKERTAQILTFSRASEQSRRPVVLESLLDEVRGLLEAVIPSSVRIRMSVEPGLAPVHGEPTQLHQVLMNLATNAAQAMPDGGDLTVEVQAAERPERSAAAEAAVPDAPGWVSLRVSDTGHGMTAEVCQRVFEPFFTTREVGKGTGLGLSVVHGIVTSHGGAITLESELGKGATFTVVLPTSREAVTKEVSGPPASGGCETILLVDDEPALTRFFERVLRAKGYQVDAHTDPLAALEALKRAPCAYQLLITDQSMPGLTGTNLAGKVREVRSDLPVLLISGDTQGLPWDALSRVGVSCVLQKPVLTADLLTTVRRALSEVPRPS